MDRATFFYKFFIGLVIVIAIVAIGAILVYDISKNKADNSYTTSATTQTNKIRTIPTETREPVSSVDVTTKEKTDVIVTMSTQSTTTVKTTTSKKAGTTKKTTKATTKYNPNPMALGLSIRHTGLVLKGTALIQGGVEPYNITLSLYKDGQLLKTVYNQTTIEVDDKTVTPAIYRIYCEVTDADGQFINLQREMEYPQ